MALSGQLLCRSKSYCHVNDHPYTNGTQKGWQGRGRAALLHPSTPQAATLGPSSAAAVPPPVHEHAEGRGRGHRLALPCPGRAGQGRGEGKTGQGTGQGTGQRGRGRAGAGEQGSRGIKIK